MYVNITVCEHTNFSPYFHNPIPHYQARVTALPDTGNGITKPG